MAGYGPAEEPGGRRGLGYSSSGTSAKLMHRAGQERQTWRRLQASNSAWSRTHALSWLM